MATMNIGIIGLGKMGYAIAARAAKAGHRVHGFDPSEKVQEAARSQGIEIVPEVERIARASRIIWLMVPAGDLVDDILGKLMPHLQKNSIIVDGGNSNFHDSIRRAALLKSRGHIFLDCGTSGGIWGLKDGFCLMIGGDKKACDELIPLFSCIAAPNGFEHVGPSGAGHYVKMVHNGIEYGLMQAYAEGFHLLKEGSFKDVPLDLEVITRLWNSGAVIRSFLLSLSHDIFKEDQSLHSVSGAVEESGMGKWTVEDARTSHVAVPVLDEALKVREWSRATGGNYATKVVALLRKQFGGHSVGRI